jgi:hypothetical protein
LLVSEERPRRAGPIGAPHQLTSQALIPMTSQQTCPMSESLVVDSIHLVSLPPKPHLHGQQARPNGRAQGCMILSVVDAVRVVVLKETSNCFVDVMKRNALESKVQKESKLLGAGKVFAPPRRTDGFPVEENR